MDNWFIRSILIELHLDSNLIEDLYGCFNQSKNFTTKAKALSWNLRREKVDAEFVTEFVPEKTFRGPEIFRVQMFGITAHRRDGPRLLLELALSRWIFFPRFAYSPAVNVLDVIWIDSRRSHVRPRATSSDVDKLRNSSRRREAEWREEEREREGVLSLKIQYLFNPFRSAFLRNCPRWYSPWYDRTI